MDMEIGMKEKILVVDDSRELRYLAGEILNTEGYEVSLAKDGREALKIFDAISPDLVISDIAMPEMNGFAFLEAVRSREEGAAVPFLFLSAYSRNKDLSQARRLAVDDYIFKPFDAQELLNAVRVRLARRRAVQIFDTREAHLQTVLLMANVIEARDPYTRGHVDRVCELSLMMGEALGWYKPLMTMLKFGAILHDIGKIIVPTKILNKEGRLMEDEWRILRQHPEAGAKMLEDIKHLRPAIPFVLYHHEKWDGSGYPFGLKEKEIPIEGRLLAIADVYDAITSDRSYHKGCSKEEALKMIKRESGVAFDPALVEIFLKLDLPRFYSR